MGNKRGFLYLLMAFNLNFNWLPFERFFRQIIQAPFISMLAALSRKLFFLSHSSTSSNILSHAKLNDLHFMVVNVFKCGWKAEYVSFVVNILNANWLLQLL